MNGTAPIEEAVVAVPQLSSPARLDPVFLTEQDVDDLSTFFGLPKQDCVERLKSYSPEEMASLWRRRNPQTADGILAFYCETDLYIWELMQWHASLDRRPYWRALKLLTEMLPPGHPSPRVLDFGCGIGTDGLFLALRGYDVILVDVDGPAFKFAQHRFTRRGLRGTFRVSQSGLPTIEKGFSAAICFDVFEHLPDPLGAARRLIAGLEPGGLLLQRGAFGESGGQPCHLREHVKQFAGLRWHIWLTSLGVRPIANLVYQKCMGKERLLQDLRFGLWKLTGLWVTRVDHNGESGRG